MSNYCVAKEVSYEVVDDEIVLFLSSTSSFYTFNKIGAEVFKMIADHFKLEEIVNSLHLKYGTSQEIISEDINSIIDSMLYMNILKLKQEEKPQ